LGELLHFNVHLRFCRQQFTLARSNVGPVIWIAWYDDRRHSQHFLVDLAAGMILQGAPSAHGGQAIRAKYIRLSIHRKPAVAHGQFCE
jgi:hypothetical protein